MAKITSYRDLSVWQKAMNVVEAVYRITASLPDTERYGLRTQAQRSAVSVPCNIAEGFGRDSPADYARFLTIARASLMELETQLTLLVRLDIVDRNDMIPLWDQCQEVGKMLTGLRSSIQRSETQTRKKMTAFPTA